jgi:hypothetical protein
MTALKLITERDRTLHSQGEERTRVQVIRRAEGNSAAAFDDDLPSFV